MSGAERWILGFSHIGKTGGTTLIHLLRRNFFFRYCDVEPLAGGRLLTGDDLATFFRVNPLLECIAGHSIRPYGELKDRFPKLQYITLLRDPVNRCVSQYQQRVKKYGYIDFGEFLQRKWLPNLQTRFIAGDDDVGKAKEILERDFLLVGVVEEFDAFLAVLMEKLKPKKFVPVYTAKRVESDRETKRRLVEEYGKDLISLHKHDLELYRFVRTELFVRQKRMVGTRFQENLETIKSGSNGLMRNSTKAYSDYVLRKVYYNPMIKGIKVMRGSGK